MAWVTALDVVVDVSFLYNGLYDIACAVAILRFPNVGLANLHTNVFDKVKISAFTKRILAYWLITYAFPRIFAGVYRHPALDAACALTYFIEGATYHLEDRVYSTANNQKAAFVYYASYVLGVIAAVRVFFQWDPKAGWTLTSSTFDSWQPGVAMALVVGVWTAGVWGSINDNKGGKEPSIAEANSKQQQSNNSTTGTNTAWAASPFDVSPPLRE